MKSTTHTICLNEDCPSGMNRLGICRKVCTDRKEVMLKLCPFCKGDIDYTPSTIAPERSMECLVCGAFVQWPVDQTNEESVEAWNTRADTSIVETIKARGCGMNLSTGITTRYAT